MNYDLILLDILITFIAFTIAPFIRFKSSKDLYDYNQKKKFMIWNSVIVQIIFLLILDYFEIERINIVPAFLYYFVNQRIWNKKE